MPFHGNDGYADASYARREKSSLEPSSFLDFPAPTKIGSMVREVRFMEAMPIALSLRELVPQCQQEVLMARRDGLLTALRYPYWNCYYHGDHMECSIMLAVGDNGELA